MGPRTRTGEYKQATYLVKMTPVISDVKCEAQMKEKNIMNEVLPLPETYKHMRRKTHRK